MSIRLPVLVDVGEVNQVRLRVVDADADVGLVEDLANLVADHIVDALMLSSAASACWTLLMIASSAARCSVSLSSRCVSSNSRAFSSATLMLVRERLEQAHVGIAEGVLALASVER